jgi:hypothetical protein
MAIHRLVLQPLTPEFVRSLRVCLGKDSSALDMPAARAVLLTSSSQASASPRTRLSPFLATDPRNHRVSLTIATLPKTPFRKSFACHTSNPLSCLSAASGGGVPGSFFALTCHPESPRPCGQGSRGEGSASRFSILSTNRVSTQPSAFTNRDAHNSFRIRTYEKRRATHLALPSVASNDRCKFAPLFSITSTMPLSQLFSFHALALLPGGGYPSATKRRFSDRYVFDLQLTTKN